MHLRSNDSRGLCRGLVPPYICLKKNRVKYNLFTHKAFFHRITGFIGIRRTSVGSMCLLFCFIINGGKKFLLLLLVVVNYSTLSEFAHLYIFEKLQPYIQCLVMPVGAACFCAQNYLFWEIAFPYTDEESG